MKALVGDVIYHGLQLPLLAADLALSCTPLVSTHLLVHQAYLLLYFIFYWSYWGGFVSFLHSTSLLLFFRWLIHHISPIFLSFFL
jgi:hypothetical protein